MKDSFGREINYLRISLTDRCNLRCKYCMPEHGVEKTCHEDILSLEEIFEITKTFVRLGVNKVRLTGGEPLIRRDILDLVSNIGSLDGVKDFAMTTNGILLPRYARDLKAAGLTRVNISLDTLDPIKYRDITRGGSLDQALEGIEVAKEVGLLPVKINTVLIGGFNDMEIEDLVDLTKDGMDVRFIELMPIGEAAGWAEENFLSNSKVLERLKDLKPVYKDDPASPAVYYRLGDYPGRVGIINPISCKFCSSCNRVRLTSKGMLKMCLHSNREIDLRTPLRAGEDMERIVREAILTKEEEHGLEEGKYIDRNMNQIGG